MKKSFLIIMLIANLMPQETFGANSKEATEESTYRWVNSYEIGDYLDKNTADILLKGVNLFGANERLLLLYVDSCVKEKFHGRSIVDRDVEFVIPTIKKNIRIFLKIDSPFSPRNESSCNPS